MVGGGGGLEGADFTVAPVNHGADFTVKGQPGIVPGTPHTRGGIVDH